jgi:hypothetical protein
MESTHIYRWIYISYRRQFLKALTSSVIGIKSAVKVTICLCIEHLWQSSEQHESRSYFSGCCRPCPGKIFTHLQLKCIQTAHYKKITQAAEIPKLSNFHNAANLPPRSVLFPRPSQAQGPGYFTPTGKHAHTFSTRGKTNSNLHPIYSIHYSEKWFVDVFNI